MADNELSFVNGYKGMLTILYRIPNFDLNVLICELRDDKSNAKLQKFRNHTSGRTGLFKSRLLSSIH